MLLKLSDPEVSTEMEEVEKETPRASNSTFLPCSFKVLLLLTISTLFGGWTTTRIFPGGIPRRAPSYRRQNALHQVEINSVLSEESEDKSKLLQDKVTLVSYVTLSRELCDC